MLPTMKVSLYFILFSLFTVPVFMESDYSNFKALYNSIEKCSEEKDVGVCLKLKAVGIMDRALVQDEPVPLTDYLAIAKDPTASINQNSYNETESDIAARLPRSYEEKSVTLDQMLQDRITKYLESRTIQLSIPTDILIEGRKKKDKGGYMMMGALAMGSMMVQMFMGKIALIAGKALLIGKIALLLSAIIGLKKLVGGGGGGGGDSHPQVIYAHGGGDHGGWKRSMSTTSADENEAQNMAYRAYTK